MQYDWETDGATSERLEAIAKSVYVLNKNIERLTNMLEEKLGGISEDNLNVTLFTDNPIKVINEEKK